MENGLKNRYITSIVNIHAWEEQMEGLSKLPPFFFENGQKIINYYILEDREAMAKRIYEYMDSIKVLRLKKITQYAVDVYRNKNITVMDNVTENERKVLFRIVHALRKIEAEEKIVVEEINDNKQHR